MRAMRRGNDRGFTLLELMISASMVAVGLLALAGMMVPVSHQREQAVATREVLESMQTMLEQVKGTAPEALAATYHGDSLSLDGVTGCSGQGNAVTLSVDSTNPKLLRVTATAAWAMKGQSYTLTVTRSIYNPKG